MRKISLTVVAAIAIITAMLAPPLVARAQTAPRFEYLLASPYRKSTDTVEAGIPTVRVRWAGYRACAATGTEWTCREFENTVQPFPGLSAALSTLGNEGWDLVRTFDERVYPSSDLEFGGWTYMFKRQRP